jgi:hypothetical protein
MVAITFTDAQRRADPCLTAMWRTRLLAARLTKRYLQAA